jgi:hypothetical protein
MTSDFTDRTSGFEHSYSQKRWFDEFSRGMLGLASDPLFWTQEILYNLGLNKEELKDRLRIK